MTVGRPAIEITDEIVEQVKELSSRGLTNKQIALCLGWHLSTLQAKKAEYKEFSDAIDAGKALGILEITNALYESAIKGNHSSQQFYLKNRDNENWNDRKNIELTGEVRLSTEQWLDELD